MMKNMRCTVKVLPKKERLLKYKMFAVAFSYPNGIFSDFFPKEEKEKLALEYDKLFRAKEIWPYTSEYAIENEFQRANQLADISGFYRAFGLETDSQRPDFLATELEFMHYLIFKEDYALSRNIKDGRKKALLCSDAQRKFFNTHLYTAAKIIAEKIISNTQDNFYQNIAKDLINFLDSERKIFAR